MPLDAEGRRRRSRVANYRRHHPDRPELYEADQRALRAAALERRIREAVDTPPGLSLEHCVGLARQLLAAAGDAP